MSIEHGCMRFAFLLIVFAAGCGERRNPDKCLDGHCPDQSKPFCDESGEIGGEPGACVAVECSPGEFAACREDRALLCNAAGNNYEVVDCEFGCSDASGGCNACNTSDCERHIIPKYLPNVCNQLADGALQGAFEISASATLDTNVDPNCTSVVAQADGPEICVVHAGSITIKPNQTLTIIGPRAIALVADRVLDVSGVLDVSADVEANGPGGGTARSGSNAIYPNAGGGAGYRTNGGNGGIGGESPQSGGALNGGSPGSNPVAITQLLGGRRTQDAPPETGISGGAGGAATLISCRDTVDVSGIIDAGGGGGHSAFYPGDQFADLRQGAGGGSGGTVVLQGMMVRVTGQLFANGGGGGSGGLIVPGSPQASPGADGTRSTMPASGGVSTSTHGNGGAGGAIGVLPGNGSAPAIAGVFADAGAGGGSVGFLLTYTPENVAPMLVPQAVSPGFEPNETVGTNR
jgi:hypothetical protein